MTPPTGCRTHRHVRRVYQALTALLLLFPAAAAAQDFQENVGFSPNHYFESGQFGENVDVTTGNLMLRVPVGPTYQVNDLSFGITLTYNSKFWQYVDPEAEQYPYLKSDDTWGLGWTYHPGRLSIYFDPNNSGQSTPENTRLQFEDSDGSTHLLYAEDWQNPFSGYYYSKDSSYLRAKSYIVDDMVTSDPNDTIRVWKVWRPDGSSLIMGLLVGDDGVAETKNPFWGSSRYEIDPSQNREGWYTIREESAQNEAIGENTCSSTAPSVIPGEPDPCTYIEYFWEHGENPIATNSLPTRMATPPNLRFVRDSIGRTIEITGHGSTEVVFSFPFLGSTIDYKLQRSPNQLAQPYLSDALFWNPSTGQCELDPVSQDPYLSDAMLVDRLVYPAPFNYTMDFGYGKPVFEETCNGDGIISCDSSNFDPNTVCGDPMATCVPTTPLAPDCTGLITERWLPTGAKSEYDYFIYKFNYRVSQSLVQRRFKVQGRPDAVWRYSRDPDQMEKQNVQSGSGCCRASLDAPGDGSGVPIADLQAWKNDPNIYSNPPRVFEQDPDGNLTVYYLFHNLMDPQTPGAPQAEIYGMTWAVERVRGASMNGVVESLEGYRYGYETEDLPHDAFDVADINRFRPTNIRKKRTKRFLLHNDGTYETLLTEQQDFDGYGHYQTATVYQANALSGGAVYRTSRTNYALAASNPDHGTERVNEFETLPGCIY